MLYYAPPCFVKLMIVEGSPFPPQPTVITSTTYGTKGPTNGVKIKTVRVYVYQITNEDTDPRIIGCTS